MRVVELTAYQVRIPLRKPFRHASHTRDSSDNLIVRCMLEDQTQGFGEGVPREYVTGETIDGAMNLLLQSELGAQVEGCPDFLSALALAERLRLSPVPGDDRHCQGNAARCAVELAILDAYGRHFSEPLSTVTRVVAPDLHEPKPWVRYSGAISSASGHRLRLAAWLMRFYRFRQVKVKVGIEGQDDVARLRSIRRRVGRRTDLRVDANEAWPRDQAAQRILDLKPFGISAVEQPVAHAEVDVLADVRRQTGVPIMLDESLCGPVDAQQAVAQGTCDLFNIRLSKCGGFIPSLRLAQFARRHGLGYQLGCQVGETAILSAAGRHFATSVAGLRYLEGSYDRHLVRESLARTDITFRWGGWARCLLGAGLGVQLAPGTLERMTRRKESLLG
jgi:muconate cycloisomerase